MVRDFIVGLAAAIREQDVSTINTLYDVRFNTITDRYFKSEKWPAFDVISPLIGGGLFAYCVYHVTKLRDR